jgi:GNAT superfamily N-acetyltransferase
LSVLDYPRAAVVSTLRQALETGAADDLSHALAKLPGIDYTPIAKPEDDEAGFQWGEMWRDTKKHEGFGTSIIEPQFGDSNIWLRRGLGLAGDIGADPLAWLSSGTHAASGVENRIGYANKLLDAQNLASKEARAATEAADTAAEWARLMGGTGADEAMINTAGAAERATQRIDELSKIGNKDALDLINRRGVNVATKAQLEAMGAEQHALRLSGVPIQDVLAGPARLFGRDAAEAVRAGVARPSEAASRAMSRFLSPGKEAWTRTAGAGARKLFVPKGALGQTLGPAAERLLTGAGSMSREKAMRTYATNEVLRLAKGDLRAPSVQFLHQLGKDLEGHSKEEWAAMVKDAEENGVENAVTNMAPQMIEAIKSVYKKYTPPGREVPEPPELMSWTLPNGQQSRYVMPHVLSRDAFRFFNKLKKGENPLIDFIRRDMGIHDKDLLEEGGFLQRRLFRPNADGSPQTFKIGKDEITITTGSVDELEEKLGGLLRQHGFEGKLYESNPMEAWRRYIKATEKDVARNAALMHGAANFGLEGLREKTEAPIAFDPYGRDLKMQPAVGETDPRYIRGESTQRAPTGDDVWEMVPDDEATKARDAIITKGGDKNVHAQVSAEYADTAAAERQTLAQDIEGTRQQAEQAFDLAREKSAKTLARAEKIVATKRVKVAELEGEYKELLKEASANQEIIDTSRSQIHGIRSQTPKKIKAATEARLKQIADELKVEHDRLAALEAGLKNALENREADEFGAALDRFVSMSDEVDAAEAALTQQKDRARRAVANRLKRETKDRPEGYDHLVTDKELADAQAVLEGGADSEAAKTAAQLQTRLKSVSEEYEFRRNSGLEMEQRAKRIDDQLSRRSGGTVPRTGARQERIDAADRELYAQARKLREAASNEHVRANELEKEVTRIERWVKQDPWNKAQELVAKHAEQQNQIENFLNPSAGIDVRAARIRLDTANRDFRELHLQERGKNAPSAYRTPLQKSEERLTETIEGVVGKKPQIEHDLHHYEGGGGSHQIIISEDGTDVSKWTTAPDGSGAPGYIATVMWEADSGEIAWIDVNEDFQRKGIGASMLDYATKFAEENGYVPPMHSEIQTDMGAAWAPDADDMIARWARDENTLKGMSSNEANDARALLDSPEGREYAADESLAVGLRHDIDRIENPPGEPGFVEWTEVGREKPAALPRKNREWHAHDGRRRRLAGEMEAVREEGHFTQPGMGEGKSFKRAGKRRIRGYDPWWQNNPEPTELTFGGERYPQRIDQSSTKASRTRRINRLQKELDKEDAWLAKHPEPAPLKPTTRGHKYRATIDGKRVRLERPRGGGPWTISVPGMPDQAFSGDVKGAWAKAEELARQKMPDAEGGVAAIESLPPPKEGMVRLYRGDPTKPSLSPEQARKARSAKGLDWINENPEMLARDSVQGRWFTTDKEVAAKYPTNRDPGEGNIVRYVDIPQAEYDKIKGLADQPDVIKALSRDPGEVVLSAAHMRRVKDVPIPSAGEAGGGVLADLKERLAKVEDRMKNARTAKSDVPKLEGVNPWEQPFEPTWWRNSKDVFGEELGQVAEEGSPAWNAVENMYTTSDDDLELLVAEHWNKLTPEGKQRMEELGWEGGHSPGNAGEEIGTKVREARGALATAAREQGTLPDELLTAMKPPPNPEQYIHDKFNPKIAGAYKRIREQGAKGQPKEFEAIRSGIQGPADERIAALEAQSATAVYQNKRLAEMVTDLYDTRMPDPVADWQKAYDNAEAARAIHKSIEDYIEKYSVRQRAIDMVEKNRRAGAPSTADLERVAERRMRPEDAQGLMKAVDDINKFMTNAEQILPVRTRKQIEAALMAHEQALASLTTTNDLPAKALNDMRKAAKDGSLPKVLKAQLREGWREVGPDGSLIIDKDLERAFFGVEEVLDSQLFGRLFTTWTNFFKTYATLTPGFHVRNALSAIFMNATEGVGVREQLRAIRLWGEYRRAENPIEWLASRSRAEQDAFSATFASGAGGQFLEAGVGEARAGASRAKERLFSNPATRLSKRAGEWVEGPQRLALGLHTTARGGSAGEALGRISRIHFDYSQVSKFDEKAKRIIPFWTFMSRNIPLQFTQMWMKPSMYLRYQSVMRNLTLGNEDDPTIPSYITQAGGKYIGVKTPDLSGVPILGKFAPPGGMPIVVQPDMPQTRYADDLARVTSALSGNGLGQMATNLNPMITVPAEFAGRTDFFTGQNFKDDDEVAVGGAATPYAVALAAIGQARRVNGQWYIDAAALNAIRGLDPNLDRMLRLLPQAGGLEGTDKTGASTTARQAESWARWAGLPVRTVSPQQQRSELRSQAFKERDRRRALIKAGG